jgi:hypothetical protein
MIAVTDRARRAPSIVVAGSGGELLQTALSRSARPILSCYSPLPRTRDARRVRADVIRVGQGAEDSLPEARP